MTPRRSFTMLFFMFLVFGCGQKGNLMQPDQEASTNGAAQKEATVERS